MKPGTHIKLPDGREGTVVFHSLTGYGIKWGRLPLSGAEIEQILAGNGSLFKGGVPEGYDLEPEAMLRKPYPSADLECVGDEYEIIGEPS